MDKTISPIALDLGGMNTGVYLSHYVAGSIPSPAETDLATIVLPEEGGKMTWSQVGRTATRHRIRSNKRAKLAKRLLKQIFLNGYAYSLTEAEWTAISGLLNRRGYNRTEVELDLTLLELADPYPFAELLPEYFTHAPLNEQWDELQNEVPTLRKLQKEAAFTVNKKDAKSKLFSESDKDEQAELIKVYQTLQEAVNQIVDNADFGHQHRRDYLADIEKEIQRDSRLSALVAKLSAPALHRVIGHISNLQLRTLRWYFNDASMAEGDRYDDARLKAVLLRWLQGWHTDTESRLHRDQLTNALNQPNSTLQALQQVPAEYSIPPYEDQNNRRPPKDQTLWLCPSRLTQRYGDKWQLWANNLRKAQPEWAEGLDKPFQTTQGKLLFERSSRLPAPNKISIEWNTYRDALFLQRILDRSKTLDPYALRLLARGDQSQAADAAKATLNKDLGSQHLETFIGFCSTYYNELNQAKQGLWLAHAEHNLFECADINPPSKKKILHVLVGNILQHPFDESGFNNFLDTTWKSIVTGRSSIRSICQKAEETRKEHGNLFNTYLSSIQYRMKQGLATEKALKGAEKDIWNTHKNCEKAAQTLAKALGHNERQQSKYANSFSLAQLFTLIETDRHGFSKVTLAAHQELNWRMQNVTTSSGEVSARCSRLVSDSIRPFDGVLRRVLDRQAYEIASLKAEQIKRLGVRTQQLLIPIIAEENRFTFSVGLADIKKDGSKRKKLADLEVKQSERWQDKDQRIQQCNQYCPYTGELIGSTGEIDHILPRAQSRDQNGTVFDSEANLIWCSRRGNQLKKAQRYYLSDLKPAYLNELFGSSNTASIAQQIEQSIAALPDNFLFLDLTPEQQRDVRHALFLQEDSQAYHKARRRLATQQSARVNGTQAWLVRGIMEKLSQQLHSWCQENQVHLEFRASRANAENTSRVRKLLANHNPEYTKTTPQPVASHAIDAVCALAEAASTTLAHELQLGEGLNEDAALIEQLITPDVQVRWVERKPRYHKKAIASQPLFKEGIFSENFLPIWACAKGLSVGFDPNTNATAWAIKNPDEALSLIQPVLEHSENAQNALTAAKPSKLSIDKHKAFSLLAKVAREAGSTEERALADLLDALRYTTSKKDCKNKIYDTQKKSFNAQADILKDKYFDIGVKYSHKAYGKLSGKIRLPAYYDWIRLLKTPAIASKLGTKGDDLDWLALSEDFFKAGSNRAHSKTRRVFSMPMLDSPSGGYRIKRKTADGKIVWQLMAIEGTGSTGFAVNNGKIDWNTPVPVEALTQSGVTGVGERWSAKPDASVAFDQWLTLPCAPEGVGQLAMAPGTKDRRYIRITQPFAILQKWLAAAGAAHDEPFNLPSAIKVDPSAFQNNHRSDLLGKPRSNLFIERVGSTVSYWYIVESSSTAMKNAYQEAYSQLTKD